MKKRISSLLKGALALTIGLSTLTLTSSSKSVSAAPKEESYTQYVDNFMCTQGDHGILFPGSVVPGGIVKLSPETNVRTRAGYDYSADKILGFSHTRIEGVGGGGAGGDVLVTPTYMDYSKRPDKSSREQQFYKVDGKKVEEAHPGYYTADIIPNTGKDSNYESNTSIGNIKAEVTSDIRTGVHRYTFPKAGNVNLLVDMNYCTHGRRNASLNVEKTEDNKVSLSGRFSSNNVLSGNYTMYFYMEVDKEVVDVTTWENDGGALGYKYSLEGTDIGAVLSFNVKEGESIQVKTSISPINEAQAKTDMKKEVSHWDFNKVKEHADDLWNEVLGKVRIESSTTSDPDNRLKRLFYTNLYHMFMTPVNATSTDGKWRGNDMKLYIADNYTHYDSWTFWDDYRKYAIIGLVNPDLYRNIAKSIADLFETGYSDTGSGNHPVLTVRNENAGTVLADAVKKGVIDIENIEVAYQEAKKVADKRYSNTGSTGYVSGKLHDTAYYCLDAYGISVLAEALGKTEEAAEYAQKALTYKKQIRENAITINGEQLNVLWPKYSDGSWRDCTPDKWQDANMYQGTLWQYNWYDSYDFNGLVELMGGKENAHKILSYIFGEQDPDNGKAMLHSNVNEVDVHLPYAFNFAGKPSKTQYWARKIYSDKTWNRYRGDGEFNPPIYDYVYKLEPEGFLTSMDDDCGTMSAMYVAAAMGLFPLTPGDTTYQIGSPFFEKLTLDLGNGKTFTVEANNVSADNFYIQSATLNGKTFNRSWLDYSEIIRGGVLSFEMGSEPSTWAEDGLNGYSLSDTVPTNIDGDDLVYSTATFNESAANDGSIENTIQLTVKNNEFTGNVGDDLAASGAIKISNVPAGLNASVIKTAADTVEIKLAGKAEKHTFEDSVSNVKIEVTETATNSAITSNRIAKDDIKVMFTNDSLIYSTTMLAESATDDGSIAETSTITLTGDTVFTGSDGEDLVATGKVKISNVPEGLTAKVVKTSYNTAVLSFAGKAVKHDENQDVTVEFTDAAFDGNTSTEINGANLAGLTPLIIDFYKSAKTALENLVAEAETIDLSVYTKKTAKALTAALDKAKTLLETEATDEQLNEAYDKLFTAVDQLKINVVTDPTVIDNSDFVVTTDNENPENGSEGPVAFAFDGDLSTFWHTQYQPSKKALPATITIDMAKAYEIAQITYVPRSGGGNGNITSYDLYGKLNETDEYTLLKSGTLTDNGDTKVINFNKTEARYLKLVVNEGHGGFGSAAELYVHIPDGKADLKATLTEARELDSSLYTEASWADLEEAMNQAKDIINKQDATKDEIDKANDALKEAIENLVLLEPDKITIVRLEAENSNENSGNGLKNESINLGGTYDGAWVKYNDVDFGEYTANTINVRYSTRVDACALDARIEIRKDNKDGQLLGTIMLPLTGGWGDYQTVSVDLDTPISGVQDICFVLKGTTGNGRPYIANIDYMEFEQISKKQHIEAEDKDDWSGAELKIETSTDNTGKQLTNIGGARNNSWLRYNDVEFSKKTKMTVRYSHNPGTAGKNSKIEVYLDNMDGEPVGTINLPTTNGWANYTVVEKTFGQKIEGSHDVYLKLCTAGGGWVANLDWFEIDQVVETVDKSELQALYEEYKDVENEDYTEASWQSFETALANAKAMLEKEDASQEEIDEAMTELENAIDGLEKIVVTNKIALKIAVDLANAITDEDLEKVVPAVVEEFKAARDKANEVYNNASATQEEVNNAFDRLASAMQKLEFFKGDKTVLKAFIDKVSGLEADKDKYTTDTWTVFETELDEANAVYNDENAMQEEVNNAYKELVTAFLNLRLIPDKSLLEELINKAEGLNSANYTKASFDGLTKALNEAKAVYENPNATQKEVDNAKDVLTKTIAELQTVTTDNMVKTPVNNYDTASVKTGDESLTGMFATIALLSVAGYAVFRRKED